MDITIMVSHRKEESWANLLIVTNATVDLIQMIMIIILAEERNVSRVIAVIVLEIVEVTLLFKCSVYVYVRFMEKLIIGVIGLDPILAWIYLQNVQKHFPEFFKEVENSHKKESNRGDRRSIVAKYRWGVAKCPVCGEYVNISVTFDRQKRKKDE